MADNQYSLSRSISRATLLHYCQKKYLFAHYNIALKNIDKDLRLKALLLKNLTTIEMRTGSVIHGIISDYLRSLKEWKGWIETMNEIWETALKDMDELFNHSKTKDYAKYNKDDKRGLTEHYYKEESDEKFSLQKEKVMSCIKQFVVAPLHATIEGLFWETDKVFIESKEPNFETMKWSIDGIAELKDVLLRSQPDLGIILNEWKKYIIYDWKTGVVSDKPLNEVSDQLKVYAYKLLNKLQKTADEIEVEAYEVYLSSMQVFGGKVEQIDIEEIWEKIAANVMDQKKLVVDGDVIKNIPLNIEKFARTIHHKKCERCTFREVCEDVKKYENKNEEPVSVEENVSEMEDSDLF